MARFEYRMLDIDSSKVNLPDELTKAGALGWRVVEIMRGTQRWNYEVLLERPVERTA